MQLPTSRSITESMYHARITPTRGTAVVHPPGIVILDIDHEWESPPGGNGKNPP